MAFFTGSRAHDVCHEEADFGWGEKFTRALPGAFGKFSQEELVGAAEEIGLHIGKPQAVARIGEGFNDLDEFLRVDIALAIALGGEIHEVYDAGERGVVPHDGADGFCQVIADILRARALPLVIRPFITLAPVNDRPSRFGWEIEAQQVVVKLGNFQGGLSVAVFL